VATNDLRFVYDGWNVAAILNSDFSLFTSFAWGLDLSGTLQGAGGVGGLLWMTVPSGPNAGRYFCAYDGNGNVMALVSAADGSVAARYEYGPFGEVIRATGPMARENPFRWSTKYSDDETDLVMYPHRPYSPSTGRWLSRDPIGERGGLNLYAYVFNDPVNEVDPYGLAIGDWWDPRTYWNEGFLEGWSKGGQGVINAFTGGLFWPEYGLFYDTFDKQWKDLGTDGTKDDSAFKFGNNGGRVAVACLAGAGALSRTAIGNANMGWKGGEITFTRPGAPTPDWRINPFGGSGYPPHYHRRPGIGKHRPWDGGW